MIPNSYSPIDCSVRINHEPWFIKWWYSIIDILIVTAYIYPFINTQLSKPNCSCIQFCAYGNERVNIFTFISRVTGAVVEIEKVMALAKGTGVGRTLISLLLAEDAWDEEKYNCTIKWRRQLILYWNNYEILCKFLEHKLQTMFIQIQ